MKRLHPLVCIPVYDNPRTVVDVARECLALVTGDLLVVDDGSAISVETLFHDAGLTSSRVHHLRFPKNRGKGSAIQAAIAWAVKRGHTHLATIDGDGQHPAIELPKLLAESALHPWALIIGHRDMAKAENVPKISKFGRKFSNFWVKYQTEKPVTDSQSGLRLYPLVSVQNFRFMTRRYDFEIEVLIRLIWSGVEVREVPVDVVYHPPSQRVSHFRKFRDNARISALNAVLVVAALLRTPGSPARLSAALALGVWIGCIPLYGFHTLMAATASFFLRLNFVALFVGTQVSLPFFVPFLLIAAAAIGVRLPFATKAGRFLAGAVSLGTILGLAVFFAAWIFFARRERRKEHGVWTGRQRGGRLGNAFLRQLLQLGGRRLAYACVMIFVVPYFYLFARKARLAASGYWRIVQPERSWAGRQGAVLAQMYRFSTVLLDSVYLSLKGPAGFELESHGFETMKTAVDRKRGVLMVSAHIGAWEVAARLLKRHGFSERLHVVRYEAEGLTLSKMHAPLKEYVGIEANRRELPILQIREALGRGDLVTMMADRPTGSSVELLPFFGRLAPVDLTPFRLATACDSSVLCVFGLRESYRKYSFHVTEISASADLPRDERAVALAQDYLRAVESAVRARPQQWFNWFEFWSADAVQSRPY